MEMFEAFGFSERVKKEVDGAFLRFAVRTIQLHRLGGAENVSEIQRQLIAKFATLALQLEAMEAAAIEGNEIDLDLFGRCAGHLRRIAEALGLKRVAREVGPSVAEYVAGIAADEEIGAA